MSSYGDNIDGSRNDSGERRDHASSEGDTDGESILKSVFAAVIEEVEALHPVSA
jgi:hypothetical protein